jgi:hypothetical protein
MYTDYGLIDDVESFETDLHTDEWECI